MFPSSTKREIRYFHVVVVQRRLRNVQKSMMDVQSCYFANRNLLVFCRSCCRRRRRRCLSAPIFISEDWDLGHQTLSANPSGTMFVDVCERLVPVLCCCCSYLPVLDNFSCQHEKQSGLVWTYPNSLFLYFISLYFSTIGLTVSKSLKKKMSFNLIHHFHTCCAIFFTRIFDLCTSAPKVRVREYIFQPHIFCIL